MKKLTKKEKSQIAVWSEINSSLVEQFKPVEEVVEVVSNKPVLSGQEQIIKVLQEATGQIKENEKVLLTKADIGRTIFEEELKNGLVRKTVINRLINEALLTKNGASTYFQNMKNKAGLVNHKPKTA